MPSWLWVILGVSGTAMLAGLLKSWGVLWGRPWQRYGYMQKKAAKKARAKVEKTLEKDMDDIDKLVEEGKSRAEAVLARITVKRGDK